MTPAPLLVRAARGEVVERPPVWAMLVSLLRSKQFRVEPGLEHRLVRHYRGDLVALGLGELLVPAVT